MLPANVTTPFDAAQLHPPATACADSIASALLVLSADPADPTDPTATSLLSLCFTEWKHTHSTSYNSKIEHDRRFMLWIDAARTSHAARATAICPVTKRNILGMNGLADRDSQEFRQLLSGRRADSSSSSATFTNDLSDCPWWNFVCSFRRHWYFENGHLVRVNTPSDTVSSGTTTYDLKNGELPQTVDWRESGAVGAIAYQGSCGACWAMAAAGATESALFLKYGKSPTVCVAELLTCDTTTYACDGGWPQNAFEFLAKKGARVWDVDETCAATEPDTVLELTSSYEKSSVCAVLTDEAADAGLTYNGISGYSYATSPCACYSSGAGCGCRSQNEALMARNIASNGPAAICVDSSTWKYYSGGVITAANIGCESKFGSMVHCLQVVGFVLDQDGGGDGSYWILKNQWGEGWGVNGYAYVQMGTNACGVANDVTMADVK